jgi:hypothetical protein
MELDAALQNRGLDSEKPGKCEILPEDGGFGVSAHGPKSGESERAVFSFV